MPTPRQFNYVNSTRLERLLFIAARDFLLRCAGQELQGLSDVHLQQLQNTGVLKKLEQGDRRKLERLFEVKRVLQRLASADPYVRDDVVSEITGEVSESVQAIADFFNKP